MKLCRKWRNENPLIEYHTTALLQVRLTPTKTRLMPSDALADVFVWQRAHLYTTSRYVRPTRCRAKRGNVNLRVSLQETKLSRICWCELEIFPIYHSCTHLYTLNNCRAIPWANANGWEPWFVCPEGARVDSEASTPKCVYTFLQKVVEGLRC